MNAEKRESRLSDYLGHMLDTLRLARSYTANQIKGGFLYGKIKNGVAPFPRDPISSSLNFHEAPSGKGFGRPNSEYSCR